MIFRDTNVISETLRKTPDPAVTAWLVRNDTEMASPTVTIAEIAFGIGKIRSDERAARLEQGLAAWGHRFADRIFPFTEAAALAYGVHGLIRVRPQPRNPAVSRVTTIAPRTRAIEAIIRSAVAAGRPALRRPAKISA